MSYEALKAAIKAKQSVTFYAQGYSRDASPHCIGWDKTGQAQVLTFQYGGGSNSGLPPGGKWRCFPVSDVSQVRANGDGWHTDPTDHSRPNKCVTQVDVEVR